MELKLPEIISKYLAKQIVEAIMDHPDLRLYQFDYINAERKNISVMGIMPEEVLDILFPEDSDNG